MSSSLPNPLEAEVALSDAELQVEIKPIKYSLKKHQLSNKNMEDWNGMEWNGMHGMAWMQRQTNTNIIVITRKF